MPKYEIWFDHTVVMACTLEIEATNEEEAKEKAWGIVGRNLEGTVMSNDPEIQWWENEHKGVDMVNCEEVQNAPQ